MRYVLKQATLLTLLTSAATGVSTLAQTTQLYPGFAKAEVYSGIGGTGVGDLTNNVKYPSRPDSVSFVKFLEFPAGADNGAPPAADVMNDYGVRVSGVIIPKETASYVFYLAADDNANFWLSTDATAANKRLLAWEPGWNPVRSFTSETRRPGCETNDCENVSIPIALEANKQYYFEALMKEGGGGDNIAVAWAKEGSTPPEVTLPDATTTILPIGSEFLGVVASTQVAITQQPRDVNGALFGSASFTVGINDVPGNLVTYQWKKDGQNIAGATNRTYNTPAIAQTDNAAKFTVEVKGPNNTVTSTDAILSVIPVQEVLGSALVEVYNSITGTTVGALTNNPAYPGSPTTRTTVKYLEYPAGADNGAPPAADVMNDYGVRISGFIIPKETARYNFYLAADDNANFWLSTDSSPANKRLLAWEPGWNPVRSFTAETRRPLCLEGDCENISEAISLTAGQKYYFEALNKEGGGGDNLAVAWAKEGATPEEVSLPDGTTTTLPIAGEFLGHNIAQLLELGSINAGFRALTFQIRNVGASQLDPATLRVTVDGTAVTPTSTRTNDVLYVTYSHPTALAQGSTHAYTIEAKDTGGRTVTAANSFTIPNQFFPTANLKAPAIVNNEWAMRFIYDVGTVSGIPNVIQRINAVGTAEFTNTWANGTVVDVTSPTHNFGAGFIPGDPYPDAVTTVGNWTGEDFIILSVGNINITEEADYTFGIHSDDGFAMRIRCGEVVRVSGAGTRDAADPEAVVHPADTGDSNTRAVYHLKRGVYRIEFFWWERGGGDHGEIYAAKGNFAADADTDTWQLVGDAAAGGLAFTNAAATECAGPVDPTPGNRFTSVTRSGNNLVLTFSSGVLESADKVDGPYTPVTPATSPATVPITGTMKFYRLR